MNSEGEIDSLCADSENKFVIGDLNSIQCSDRQMKNKSKELQKEEMAYKANDYGQKSVEADLEQSEEIEKVKHSDVDVNVKQETNNAVYADDVDGISGDLLELKDDENTSNGVNVVPDAVDKNTLAILQFSDTLAENILQEALLINDIHTRDKLNKDDLTENDELDRDLKIKKTLFPNDNGVIRGRESGAGYDRYLIDKLLGSKADPEELIDTEGFDGNEEHFKRDKESTYPGLDCDDAYVKAGLDRPESDRENSDKNNNEMTPGLVESLDDTVLQTIHEDAELVIEYATHVTEEVPKEQVVANANIDVDDGIDEGVVEDEPPNSDDKADDNSDIEEPERQTKPLPEKPSDDTEITNDMEDDTEDEYDEKDCCEMTFREKRAMVVAVRKGDVDRLEKLLEKKNADINMIWYGENLLMVAIRAEKQEMCEFLVDNGVNWEHVTKLVEVDENEDISVHKMTARQMAYDLELLEIVELLDAKSDNLFPFIVPKVREPRLRQPIFPFCPPPLDEGMRQELFTDPDELLEIHKQNLIERARIAAEELAEENAKAEKSRKSVTTTGGDDIVSYRTVKSKHSCSDDEISQVFGPDEGYETMSPDLSRSNRHFFHVIEPVSIRSTRSNNMKKAVNTSKVRENKRMGSPDYPMYHNPLIESVGSYNFESRYWHMPKSAPQLRNYSYESLNDTPVRVGLPFVHGDTKKKLNNPPQSARKNLSRRRAASAHSNVSPFSQVAKLLEQSRLFSPLEKSRPTSTHLPAISSRKSSAKVEVTHTKINYIYADRNSAKKDTFSEKSDLLPRRKIKC